MKSFIYSPFRALGYITNDIPISIQQRGQTFSITTCIGPSFQIYDGEKFNLLFVGSHVSESISAIVSFKDFTFVASGAQIIINHRAKQIATLSLEDVDSPIEQLLIFGDLILALHQDNCIRIWDHTTYEYYNILGLSSSFTATHMMHPSTYLNKILIASNQGTMQLWNIKTMSLIYEFSSYDSPITTLSQAPSVDIIAVGFLNGIVAIHDIKADKELFRFQQEGKVTAITFRTDGHSIMATSNMQGDVTLWDLENRRLFHVLKGAHDSNIHSCVFYPCQPILITASSDNSLKMWIFDSLDGEPRLLKSRSGHHKPPTRIQFYSNDGKVLLSSGQDRSLRLFSMLKDSQNVELSQGSLEKRSKTLQLSIDDLKLPLILDFDSNETRAKDWDNILTCHRDDNQARTWNMKRKAIGKYTFTSKDSSTVKSTCVSACGHFGFIGSSMGRVDKFNMQSGLSRGSYIGHSKAITSIVCDNTNTLLITSSLDGTVNFWSFQTCKLLESIKMNSCITFMRYHRESNMLAIVTDDLCVRIMDSDTRKTIREFYGHESRITDLCFTPDARWIITASLDATIRTWDIPTSYLIDIFKVDHVATSVSFSPIGDFLVSTHVDQVGVFVWANRSLYENIPIKNVSFDDVIHMKLPLSSGITPESTEPEDMQIEVQQEPIIEMQDLVITDDLITLSSLAKTKWQNLFSLEAIKKRNKPKEAPKAPEKAPFFLSTLPGVDPKFIKQDSLQTIETTTDKFNMSQSTKFNVLLEKANSSNDYENLLSYMKSLSPTHLDFEIRCMDRELFKPWFKAVYHWVNAKIDFEMVQCYMAVFIKIYGEEIMQDIDQEMEELLVQIQNENLSNWKRLQEMMQFSLCMIEFQKQ